MGQSTIYALKVGAQTKLCVGADTSGALRHYAHVSWHVVVESYITTAFTGPGLRWTHLHPGYFMANVYSYAGLPFFDKKTNTITSLLPPYGISPWIDNWDIADVGARCLLSPDKHAGKVYQLATQPFAIDEFCERVSKTLGKKIGFKVLSADELLEMVRERDPDDIGSLSYMMCISNMLKITQVSWCKHFDIWRSSGR